MRTHDDKKVADLAKDTVRKWKNDVAGQKQPSTSSSTDTMAGPATSTAKTASSKLPTRDGLQNVPLKTSDGAVKAEKSAPPATKKVRDAISDGISKVQVNEKTRDGSIILLYNAIVLDSEQCIPKIIKWKLIFSSVDARSFRH